jgi:FkbM family methyltransferase
MERTNPNPKMTLALVEQGCFRQDRITIIDVGAAGGVAAHWDVYGDQALICAFEADPRECKRLIEANTKPNVSYYPVAIGREECTREFFCWPERGGSFYLADPEAAAKWQRMSTAQMWPVPSGLKTIDVPTIDIDTFCTRNGIRSLDFLKIDTDGSDYEVLLGARASLRSRNVLGVCLEVFFEDACSKPMAVFGRVSEVLAEVGLVPFDLDVHRYSRKELPAPFIYAIPAQTRDGQILWGDAIYFRDVLKGARPSASSTPVAPTKLLKLASLYEIHGLADCAAELLCRFRQEIAGLVDVDDLLDKLTPPLQGQQLPYRDYLRRFKEEPQLFYPVTAKESVAEVIPEEKARVNLRGPRFGFRLKNMLKALSRA